MAQHDYILNNQSGAAFRSDLNSALAAIVSNNSGTAEPTTTYAYMMWADTTNGKLKLRNGANNAWIELGNLADAGLGILSNVPLGTVSAPGIAFTGDPNTGIYSPGADQLALTVGGVQRLNVTTAALLPTLPMRGADGTAANPAYSFSADTDTGLYRSGANILALATGGSDRFVFGASGQLGIAGANYGTAGQVLVSGGSGAAPSWANGPGNGPAFSAWASSVTTIGHNVATKVQFQTEEFDTNSNFASSTFTPTVAGYYQISGNVQLASPVSQLGVIYLYKNGTAVKRGPLSNAATYGWSVNALIYLNGSTDYVELYMFQNNGSSINTNTTIDSTFFQASLVRAV